MKLIVKTFFFLVLIVVLILVIAAATSRLWIRSAISQSIQEVTGFPATIERVHVNLRGSEVGIYGVQINNPAGFSDELFASIPEIFIDFDFSQFISDRKLHFEVIRLNLAHVSIARNERGQTNLDLIKTLKKDKKEKAALKMPKRSKQAFLVDEFVLTIRKVSYHDRFFPVPMDRTIDVNINDEVFRGVQNAGDIVRIVLMKIIYSASFGNLGAPVDFFKQQFDQSLLQAQEILNLSTGLARVVGGQALGEGFKMVENVPVPKQVNQVTQEVKGKATGLFQNAERLLTETTNTLSKTIEKRSGSSTS